MIAVDQSHVFVASSLDFAEWRISRVPKTGGSLEEILPEATLYLTDIEVAGDSVALLDSNTSKWTSARILKLPKSGGTTSVLWADAQSTTAGSPYVLASDGKSLFFLSGGKVFGLNPSDGTLAPVGDLPASHGSVAVDDDFVYVSFNQSIHRMAKTGGAPEVVAEGLEAGVLFPMGDHLYYLVSSDEFPYGPSSLWRVSKSGGAPAKFLDEGPDVGILPVAFDSDQLWWIRYDADFGAKDVTVMKSPVSGGPGTAVTADLVKSNFASDETFLYWVRDSGAIMRMVR